MTGGRIRVPLYRQVEDLVDASDSRFSPLRATSHAGLPRAYLATAPFDPLRDEGEAQLRKVFA